MYPITLHHLADDTRGKEFFETGVLLGTQLPLGKSILELIATTAQGSKRLEPPVFVAVDDGVCGSGPKAFRIAVAIVNRSIRWELRILPAVLPVNS